MLKLAPESDLETTVETENDDAINCATCGHLVTRLRWAITKNGHHEHEFMNPAGFAFLIQCFSEAPGVGAHGFPSDEFTWFKGYDWQVAQCQHCGVQLGWVFVAENAFYGLIRKRLSAGEG